MADRASYEWRRYVTEALGTFALVAIGPGAAMVAAKTGAFGVPGIALAFGLVVTIVVAATGHLSGAHINPARSLGPAVVGGIWTSHWLYWCAPIIGMIVSMRAYEMLRGAATSVAEDNALLGVEGPVQS